MSGSNEIILRAGLDTADFEAGAVKIRLELEQLGATSEAAAERGGSLTGAFDKLRSSAETLTGVLATVGIGLGFEELVKVNGEYDRLATSLITVTGSAEGAHEAIKNLITFANTSPYTLQQVTGAFIELRNSGLDASTEALTEFGNIASGFGRPIGDLAHAVSDVVVGITEPLKQFGIDAQASGDRVTLTFRGMSESVPRDAHDIQTAIERIGNTDFAGDLVRQGQTIEGLQSTLSDATAQFLRAIGDGGFSDAYRDFLKSSIDATNSLDDFGTAIGRVLGAGIEGGIEAVTRIENEFSKFSNLVIDFDGRPMKVLDAIKEAWSNISGNIADANSAMQNFGSSHPGIAHLLFPDLGKTNPMNAVATPDELAADRRVGAPYLVNGAVPGTEPYGPPNLYGPNQGPFDFLGAGSGPINAYADQLRAASEKTGVPLGVLGFQMFQESSGNPRAGVGTAHVGLGQFDEATGRRFGLVGDGFDHRTDPNASIDAMARYDQIRSRRPDGTDDYHLGLTRYGTLNGSTAVDQRFTLAMQQGDPTYAAPNLNMTGPQAANEVATLGQSAGLGGLTGAAKVIAEALTRAGLTSTDDSGVAHPLTREELQARIMGGQASYTDMTRFDQITKLAPIGFNAQQDRTYNTETEQAQAPGALVSPTLQGPMAEMMAQAQQSAHLASLNNSSVDEFRLALTNLTRALGEARENIAQSIQGQDQDTTRFSRITGLTGQEGTRFDPVTLSYVADTRAVEAQSIYDRIDPKQLATPDERTLAMSSAQRQAQAEVDRQTATERVQDRVQGANSSDVVAGAQRGLTDFGRTGTDVAKEIGDAFNGTFSSLSDTLARFMVTGRVNWTSFANQALEQLARIPINFALGTVATGASNALGTSGGGGGAAAGGGVLGALGGLLGGLFGGGGGIPGVAPGAVVPGQVYAMGGTFDGSADLSHYSNTIVDTPTPFRFAQGGVFGEAGPEAILPLQRDSNGRLGISGGSGGGGGVNVVAPISIGNAGMNNGVMDARTSKQLSDHVETQVRNAVRGELAVQQKSGGQLYEITH